MRTIVFNSQGGSLGAALELGRIIRENDLATGVGRSEPTAGSSWYEPVDGGTCESACAFAFLAGKTRYANEDFGFARRSGRVGMHQFYTQEGQNIPSSDTQQIMGQVLLYMLDMGINAELLSIAARTPPDQMYYFTRDQLIDLSVLTLPEPGPEPLGLFVDNGGLATGWGYQLDTGEDDPTVVLRCSSEEKGWVLKVRGNAINHDPMSSVGDPLDDFTFEIGKQRHDLPKDRLSQMNVAGHDVIEAVLPGSLPVFAEQDFIFSIPGPRAVGWEYFGASQTLPDAETFTVLARLWGLIAPASPG